MHADFAPLPYARAPMRKLSQSSATWQGMATMSRWARWTMRDSSGQSPASLPSSTPSLPSSRPPPAPPLCPRLSRLQPRWTLTGPLLTGPPRSLGSIRLAGAVITASADRLEPAADFAAAEASSPTPAAVKLTPLWAEREGEGVIHHLFETCTAGGSCGRGYFRLEQARGSAAWRIATDVWTLTPYKDR
mmetsp:Transcript_20669/g.68260  ORF Transcript_20669/g.68260 Transcript_20669/m.68260 type:complete len:189 (+) Transcript_20669:109-675(+)